MDLLQIKQFLAQVELRDLDNHEIIYQVRDSLSRIKEEAVSSGNQALSKEIWCYETILKIQNKYLKAFQEMKAGEFYGAWCTLERVEINLIFLERHFDINISDDKYKLAFIKSHTERFQSLFPYKFFTSPGMLYLEKRCSICDHVVSLKEPCGHFKGEIYDGEMCSHNVTEGRLIELSVVTNPAQKYSVPFIVNSKTNEKIDHYDYSTVNYVIRGLREPFHSWNFQKTKTRHPHSRFKDVGRNNQCPCESGKKYKQCCLKEDGVLRPHIVVDFSVAPPEELPSFEYNQ